MPSSEETDRVITAATKALGVPYKWGHTDVGEVLTDYLKAECSADEAVERLILLEATYIGQQSNE